MPRAYTAQLEHVAQASSAGREGAWGSFDDRVGSRDRFSASGATAASDDRLSPFAPRFKNLQKFLWVALSPSRKFCARGSHSNYCPFV